jgi:hypothetical protein
MRLADGAANLKRELPNPSISAQNGIFYVVESHEIPYRSEDTTFEENV